MSIRFARSKRRLLPLLGLAICPAPAAAAPVAFTLIPASGSAAIIPSLNFLVCQRRNIDPWNVRQCPGWRPIRSGQTIELSGFYCVQGWWGDRKIHRGALRLVVGSGPMRYVIRPNAQRGSCA